MNVEICFVKIVVEIGLVDFFVVVVKDLLGGSVMVVVWCYVFDWFVEQGLFYFRVEVWKYIDLWWLFCDVKLFVLCLDVVVKSVVLVVGVVFSGFGFCWFVIVDGVFVFDLFDIVDFEFGLCISVIFVLFVVDYVLVLFDIGEGVLDFVVVFNMVFVVDGVLIFVDVGVVLDWLIYFVCIMMVLVLMVIFMCFLLDFGDGVVVILVEIYEGLEQFDYQVNIVFCVMVGDCCSFDYVRIILEGVVVLYIGIVVVDIGVGVIYCEFGFIIGGVVVCNQIFLWLVGEGIMVSVYQVSLFVGC